MLFTEKKWTSVKIRPDSLFPSVLKWQKSKNKNHKQKSNYS